MGGGGVGRDEVVWLEVVVAGLLLLCLFLF